MSSISFPNETAKLLAKEVDSIKDPKPWKPEIPRASESTTNLLRKLAKLTTALVSSENQALLRANLVLKEGDKEEHIYLDQQHNVGSNNTKYDHLIMWLGDSPKGKDNYNMYRGAKEMYMINVVDGEVVSYYVFDPKGMEAKYNTSENGQPKAVGWGDAGKDYIVVNPNTIGIFEPYMQHELKSIHKLANFIAPKLKA